MENLNISQLSVQDMLLVLAISEFKSVSQAAASINITQPTASYRLNKLRDIFNDPIFTNVNREMRPTLMGQRIIKTFRRQVDDVSELIAPVEFDPASCDRTFTIRGPGFYLPIIFNKIPKQFFEQTQTAALHFEHSEDIRSINQLLHERLDVFSWIFDPAGAAGIRRLVFPEIKFLVFYDPNQREAPQNIEAFAEAGYIKLGSATHQETFDRILMRLGFPPRRIACRVPTIEAVMQTVKGTKLLCVGHGLFGQELSQDLKAVELPFATAGIRHEFRWSISKEKDPGHAWFLGLIEQISRDAVPPEYRVNPDESFRILSEFEAL